MQNNYLKEAEDEMVTQALEKGKSERISEFSKQSINKTIEVRDAKYSTQRRTGREGREAGSDTCPQV